MNITLYNRSVEHHILLNTTENLNTMGELIVDFAHKRRSFIETKDVKKAVKFSPLAEVRFYKSLDEPDVKERYFSKEDYKAFQKVNVKAVKKLHQRYFSHLSGEGPKFQEEKDEDLDCILTGLENLLSPIIIQQTVQRKKGVRQAVFNEQKYQKEHGYDPLMIACVSRCHSASGVKRAQRIGTFFQVHHTSSIMCTTRAARTA